MDGYGGGGGGGGGYDGGGYMGGGGGAAGGGFMGASQGGGGGGGSADRAAGMGGDRRQTYQVATIKQVLDANEAGGEDSLSINGVSVNNIVLVAEILEVDALSTHMEVTLGDFTGVIKGKFWIDADENEFMANQRAELVPGKLVRVAGAFRTFGDTGHALSIYLIKALDDTNEIMRHRLEVVRIFLGQTRGPNPSAANNSSTGAAAFGGVAKNFNAGAAGGIMAGAGAVAGAGHLDANGLNPAQAGVLEFYRAYEDQQNGPHTDSVISALHSFNGRQVRDAIEFLQSEGHIYSTVDDDHYTVCG